MKISFSHLLLSSRHKDATISGAPFTNTSKLLEPRVWVMTLILFKFDENVNCLMTPIWWSGGADIWEKTKDCNGFTFLQQKFKNKHFKSLLLK